MLERINADLPQSCVSREAEEWIWNRTVVSEQMFGTGGNNYNDLKKLRERFDTAISKHKFCVVNAKAALEIERYRTLFNDCVFQSPKLLDASLNEIGSNPRWNLVVLRKQYEFV